MKLFKKILKIVGIVFIVLLIVLYVLFVNFSKRKSNDDLIASFKKNFYQPNIKTNTYKDFAYRVVSMKKEIDITLPTLVFVHGAPGSSLDFKKYLADSLLNTKANMISYDRIGYNFEDKYLAQKSIKFEVEILNDVVKSLQKENTILVGYSYGGPIVLAVKEKYKKILLLAPAVYSKVEPMPWMLNFYKWKLTKWLVPAIWESASEEKMNHKEELQKFENNWTDNPSGIISIHGNTDGIVPYENSLFIEKLFPKEQFELLTINDAGHGLVWSNFDFIKLQFLKNLD
jgi:pimeloyl-ACP methyl ester carboxylesterase